MTDTRHHRRGPLLSSWESTATAAALGRTLLPANRALPVPPAGDPLWSSPDPATIEDLRVRARADRGRPWPQPLASQYARFFRHGIRTAYEEPTFSRQERLTRAVVLAAVTGDDVWVDETADGITLLCEQSSWCWPAHEEYCRAHGTVLPDVDTPCVDLGAGDVAAQLAWADHVLGSALDARYPGLRNRIRVETHRRVLAPFLHRDDWHWLGYDGDVHNWCPWICGNVLVAALRLLDGEDRADDETRAHVVGKAVAGVDRYLAALPADGSVDEGYEYWWNGACRALEALDVLARATSGALDATGIPVVQATVGFPHRMHLGGEWYVNLADARPRPPRDQPWHVLYTWALRVGDENAARHAASHRVPGRPIPGAHGELGRLLTGVIDPDWLNATRTAAPLVASAWLPGIQVGVARQAAGSVGGLALAVKGGHNDEHHNHDDVGSVVIALDGVPVIVDAGRPTYTAQTFGPDRYAIWTMQSSWHNVPEIRGTPQGHGRDFRARGVSVSDEAERFRVWLDLSAAYPVTGLDRWWRTATLDREDQRVTIHDAWLFTARAAHHPGPQTRVHYLLAGDVETPEPGRVVVRPLDGARTLWLTWDPLEATSTLTTRAVDDAVLVEAWGTQLTRLELQVPDEATGSVMLTAEVGA